MQKFTVDVTFTVQMEVEANNEKEAELKVEEGLKDGEYDLEPGQGNITVNCSGIVQKDGTVEYFY